ncbi:hypothetical protein CTAYLR_007580 [Chrysophaeum taylorii]|uniref:WW domain-containing protein n=1 Tax=Chrysophaeum taylorii TaxID=2483200 RepID=A0AAD7UG33_9STRA|nr:hypothetical protein CTAYLR_007580 [Chrysophaeum taylorii]
MTGLPPGIEERVAPDGRKYYVDHINKTTTWTRPAGQSSVVAPPPPPPPPAPRPVVPVPVAPPAVPRQAMPAGWEEKRTVDGRVYYVDHNTKTTHWSAPVAPRPPSMPTAYAQAQPTVVQSWSAQPAVPQQPIVVQSWAAGGPAFEQPHAASPIIASGRRRALLIGCNYKGTAAQLHGCINDVQRMYQFLVSQGFPPNETICLTDDQRHVPSRMPTKQNILQHLDWLVGGAQRGDSLFFHFSGHGAQQEDDDGEEADGYDETIVPCDFKRQGQITDDTLWQRIVQPLPEGSRLTSIMDCCHSGTGLDLPFNYVVGRGWSRDDAPAFSAGDVQLFSGCADDQCSADTVQNMQAGGAMTNAFLKAIAQNPMPLYPEFMDSLHRALRSKGFRQKPQLSSSQKFDLSNRVFSLTEGFVPNYNTTLGRVPNPNGPRRRRRRRKKRSGFGGAGLEGFLAAGLGAAVLTTFL